MSCKMRRCKCRLSSCLDGLWADTALKGLLLCAAVSTLTLMNHDLQLPGALAVAADDDATAASPAVVRLLLLVSLLNPSASLLPVDDKHLLLSGSAHSDSAEGAHAHGTVPPFQPCCCCC